MSFHSKMIKLRKINGLTQEAFAAAVGVSRQSVYKWESGQSYPEVEKLLKIARTFSVTVDDMLNDELDVDRKGQMRPAAEVKEEEERIAREKEERRRRRAENKARREMEAAAAAAAGEVAATAPANAEEEKAEAPAEKEEEKAEPKKRGGFFGLFRSKK